MRLRLAFLFFWFWHSLRPSKAKRPIWSWWVRRFIYRHGNPHRKRTILVRDGHIRSVGPSASTKVPHDATVIDCKGLVVTAGFWNSHVHILLPGLLHSENVSSDQITTQLQQMLTQWGFTTVFDIASTLHNTNLIRSRIESGEAKGPRILTVGEPFWIKGGTRFTSKPSLSPITSSFGSGIQGPSQAASAPAGPRRRGWYQDFANSIESDGILTMPVDLAQTIAAEAHSAGKPVFAHVSNNRN